jgi:membrane-associated phospholipid phosphatase
VGRCVNRGPGRLFRGTRLADVVALRRVRPDGWWWDAAMLLGFVAVTLGVSSRALIGTDVWLRDWCDSHRPSAAYWAARGLNLLGQGSWLTGICLVLALLLAWRRHSVRPVLPVATALVLTFVSVTILKDLTRRPAPHAPAGDGYTRGYFHDGGVSYPSGHLVNAIVWYGVLALLLTAWLAPRWSRVLRVAPPAILCVTNAYLGFHWLTDIAAGVLLGLLLDRIVYRIPWDGLPLGRRLTASGWARPAIWAP